MASKELLNKCWQYNITIYLAFIGIFLSLLQQSEAINCYTCSSWNGTNPNCLDPYNPTLNQYQLECMVPKQGHIGQFPAHFCLKISGQKETTGEKLMIRTCVLESMDNQCGAFKFEDYGFRGCILTCDFDGCNKGLQTRYSKMLTMFWPVMGFVLAFLRSC
ncbi:hypothetical protein CHUAL_003821 [Chamberlinius hualienensis]